MEKFENLFQRYIDNQCSEKEYDELVSYFSNEQYVERFEELVQNQLQKENIKEDDPRLNDRLDGRLKLILDEIRKTGKKKEKNGIIVFLLKRRTVAAVFVLLLGITTYFFWNNSGKINNSSRAKSEVQFKHDVDPGGNVAVLTLSDGSKIYLDSIANGVLTDQDKTEISKSDGRISYLGNGATGKEVLYNTMETPRGGQYKLVFSDGSKVWLNAASSIRYPIVFAGKERKVEITGEAYFEIAKNPSMPFKVVLEEGAEIEVLGTHFNVNAYNDEPDIKTTLVEGLVRIRTNTSELKLEPGQQSVLSLNGQQVLNQNADVVGTITWKNGIFQFNKIELKAIMRQLSRWYDVEVEYKEDIPERFVGIISRNKPLSKVLTLLELTGLVHFQIEGRKIIVGR